MNSTSISLLFDHYYYHYYLLINLIQQFLKWPRTCNSLIYPSLASLHILTLILTQLRFQSPRSLLLHCPNSQGPCSSLPELNFPGQNTNLEQIQIITFSMTASEQQNVTGNTPMRTHAHTHILLTLSL